MLADLQAWQASTWLKPRSDGLHSPDHRNAICGVLEYWRRNAAHEFYIRRITETLSAPYGYHGHYFVLDNLDHMRQIVFDYAETKNLPTPQIPTIV